MDWLAQLLDPDVQLAFPFVRWSRLHPQWALDERVLDEHLVYLIQAGQVSLTTTSQHLLKPGTLMWLPPGTRHRFTQNAGSDGLELFHMRFTTSLATQQSSVVIAHDRWDLRDAYANLLSEYRLGTSPNPHRLRAQLYLLLEAACAPVRNHPGGFSGEQLTLLQDAIQQSPAMRCDPSDLADALALNHDHFSRVFKRHFGESARTWIARERTLRVADDLQTSRLSLADLAARYGYPDVYSLSKQFRRFIGQSPGRYRQQYRGVIEPD